jgi:hypothetical protein
MSIERPISAFAVANAGVNMRKIALWFVVVGSSLLAACGGEDAFVAPGASGSAAAAVASVAISTDKTTILSDGSEVATITAFVRDAQNRLISGVPVTFSASSGALTVTTGTTGGTSTTAVATLSTAGDPASRAITVTASAGGFTGQTTVTVAPAQPTVTPATVSLQATTTTIPSDGSFPTTVTAFVRDSSNRFIAGVPVTFTSTSGGISVTRGTTDATGTATADLTSAGDPTNRTITVTATAATISTTITVDVTGTVLNVTGPSALVLGQTSTYAISLLNSGGRGITGRTITVTSARGNTLSANSLTTDVNGRANVALTITQPGAETLTITSLGLTRTIAVAVNADSFQITTPATDGLEIPLGTPQNMTVTWLSSGAPVVGQNINFSTTRGTFNGAVNATASGVTNASGQVTVTVQATNAGGGVITASSATATTSRAVEFVALTAAAIDVQPGTFSLAPSENTTITATVRDSANNLVKNKLVSFGLQDTTGGALSAGTATTDSQGRAQVVYTASSSISGNNGVTITATVQEGATTISRSVQLTVGRRAVFISLGTGNTIEEPNSATYKRVYTVIVTDSNGNSVPGVAVTLSILSLTYNKGFRTALATAWTTTVTATCADEDANRNGLLDPGEDFNGNQFLTVGNIASVTRTVTTGTDGSATVDVIYPQEWAYYLRTRLEAKTTVQGTEFARSADFILEGAASDFNDPTKAPPGIQSPAGIAAVCTDPN